MVNFLATSIRESAVELSLERECDLDALPSSGGSGLIFLLIVSFALAGTGRSDR
jgi:hypothetical protein